MLSPLYFMLLMRYVRKKKYFFATQDKEETTDLPLGSNGVKGPLSPKSGDT